MADSSVAPPTGQPARNNDQAVALPLQPGQQSIVPRFPFRFPDHTAAEVFGRIGLIDRVQFASAFPHDTQLMGSLITSKFDISIRTEGIMILLENETIALRSDEEYFKRLEQARALKPLGDWGLFGIQEEIADILGRSIRFIIIHLKTRQERETVFRKLIDFLLPIVESTEKCELHSYEWVEKEELLYIIDNIEEFEELDVCIPSSFTKQDLRVLLRTDVTYFTVRGTIGVNDFMRFTGQLDAYTVMIKAASWLTKETLISSMCRFLNARNTRLTIDDIDKVLKHWQQFKGMWRMRWMIIGKMFGAPKYDVTKLSRDLKLTKWSFPMELYEVEVNKFINPERTWYFRNKLGTLAILEFRQREVHFFVSNFKRDDHFWCARVPPPDLM